MDTKQIWKPLSEGKILFNLKTGAAVSGTDAKKRPLRLDVPGQRARTFSITWPGLDNLLWEMQHMEHPDAWVSCTLEEARERYVLPPALVEN